MNLEIFSTQALPFSDLNFKINHVVFRVGKQLVNVPSFLVRVDSEKHIEYSNTSPHGQGRPGRVARRRAAQRAAAASGGGADEGEEED